MFGKKEKNTPQEQPVITARIETMPGAFYGGADPIIYAEQSEKTKTTAAPAVVPLPPPKKPISPPPPTSGVSGMINISPEKSVLQKPVLKPAANSKKGMFLFIAVVVLLAVAAVVYFVFFANKPAPIVPATPVTPTTFIPSPIVTPPIASTSTVSTNVATSTASSTPIVHGGGALTLPRVTSVVAKDNDEDSLTNSEEEVFGTDPEVWDSDSDGYYDGQEAANLYNPKGIAPQKIIDSGLVKEYINPMYQYRFYYPASWRVDPVGDDLKDILVSADSGDYMEIRVFPKDETLSFANWFAATLPGENFTSFTNFQNRFQVPGYKRADMTVGFFETSKAIYSVVYFYGEQEKNAFPHMMNILLQSFRVSKSGFELPVQIVLPGVVSSTPVVVSSTSSTLSF